MSDAIDVAIIGAGVIGTSLAHELARRGAGVLVVERDSPGRRATWAAAGMLSPFGEAATDGRLVELAEESLDRYAGFVHALREQTGIDVEYRTNGKLHVAYTAAEAENLRRLAAGPFAARLQANLVAPEAARELEPELAEGIECALLVGRDHRVNNRLLAQALAAAAARAGAVIRTGTPTAGIAAAGGRVTGVRLSSGQVLPARQVVIAAGSWSGDIEGIPQALPIFPVKGQMLAIDGRARINGRSGRTPISRVVHGRGAHLIPREDGRILVGSTVEEVGFRTGPTPRGVRWLIESATALVPTLADLPLVETWAGFRPGTPDQLPIIGPDPDLEGLCYASGHLRSGILLAPVTAQTLADLLLEGTRHELLMPFGIERFRSRP
ncbi:MAG: glycine oxidase ThiO [Gemmatimonadetes bacterium]|nr:glycine oxidase ThiO [Gemmatimonadota bacterium]